MFSYDRWSDLFGNQVSAIREARTGHVTLLYNSEIESIPGMELALFDCYCERIKPKTAAQRYVALVDYGK